jgi:hypothetical protein
VLLGLLVAAAVGCNTGPRIRSQIFGVEDAPYLSPQTTATLDHELAPTYRLILIGDAGAPNPPDPTLALVGVWGNKYPDRTTVLFLGDNLYPSGLHDDDRARGEGVLLQQIGATEAPKIFLPGNHDWGFSPGGRVMDPDALRNQQDYILGHPRQRTDFMPRDGCPGPVTKTLLPPGAGLERGLTLIVVDFHWWLLPENLRPHCDGVDDTDAFLERLSADLAAHADEVVVVAAHHPLRSGGPHGGLTRGFWTDIGAGVFYLFGGPLYDMWEPSYAQMIEIVSDTLAQNPPTAYVSGHEHSLQVIEGGRSARLLIVSGAGSTEKVTSVTAIDGTLFAHSHPGFIVLDFLELLGPSDALLVRVIETGKREPVFSLGLELLPKKPSDPDA